MPFELLSGPDLGGGFLCQLTLEGEPDRPTLVVHLQEGGRDASGPPRGSPTPLGFSRATTACPIGGRDCYHERFTIAAAEVGRARLAYNRLRFVLAPMLEQAHGAAEVPLAEALREVVERLATRFDASGRRWFLGGSVAAQLQGVAVTPHDIDLGTDAPGVAEVASALEEYLIEPPAETAWGPDRPMLAARAYVGSLKSGVRVEWGVPLASEDPVARYTEWGGPPAEVATVDATVAGHAVRLSRLEYYLVATAVRARPAEHAAAARRLRELGPDRPLLERLLAGAPLSDDARRAVARRVDG